jgi:hypothetical protein
MTDRYPHAPECATQSFEEDCTCSATSQSAAFEAGRKEADGRRREMRQLLHRLTKYVREDCAVTPGSTRLARLTEQVTDYLQRTADPRDILRAEQPDEGRKEADARARAEAFEWCAAFVEQAKPELVNNASAVVRRNLEIIAHEFREKAKANRELVTKDGERRG